MLLILVKYSIDARKIPNSLSKHTFIVNTLTFKVFKLISITLICCPSNMLETPKYQNTNAKTRLEFNKNIHGGRLSGFL